MVTRAPGGTPDLVAGPQDPGIPELLGGKGYGLWKLERLGIPVPAWFVLTTRATELVLGSLHSWIVEVFGDLPRSGDDDALKRAARQIQDLVLTALCPSEIRELLDGASERLGCDRMAVRSSVVGEDSDTDSHAGQMVTCLWVSRHGLERAVRECWAGAFSERALRYRRVRGSLERPVRMAVVIQAMIHSRVSGVAFTADPVTGTPAEVVVAGYGLGEGVVSDLIETDSFVRDHGEETWRSAIRRKDRRVIARDDGDGTRVASVAPDHRDQPTLDVGQLDRLADLVRGIDSAAGGPQDVEWALDEHGAFWILQARPVTTAPAGEIAIWDNANIGESYPGITLPFTYSYVRSAYQRLFGRALRQVGVSKVAVDRARPGLSHLIGIISGRLYMNLTHYYRLFRLVPGLERSVPKWEAAFGVTRPFDMRRAPRLPGWRHLVHRALAVRTGFWLVLKFLKRGRNVRQVFQGVGELLHVAARERVARPSLDGLLELWEKIDRQFLDMWTILIFNDLFALPFLDRLARLCGADRLSGGTDATLLYHRLISGLDQVRSIDPLRSILEVAAEASRSPEASALLRSDRPARDVWFSLECCAGAAAFRQKAAAHLAAHGQRTVEELKFETIPPADAPWQLIPIIRGVLQRTPTPVGPGDGEPSRMAESELRERCGRSALHWWYARWILKNARRCVADRENLSYARCRAYGALRGVVVAMGEALARSGALVEPRDVFYLRLEDIVAYARGSLPDGELKGMVALRKTRYATFASESPHHRIVSRGPTYADARRPAPAVSSPGMATLRGVPSAPGVARGRARVVLDPAAVDNVDDEILVAPATEPGWMFLMFRARGLIVERGSVLSHAAIIGRELGLPTIVAAEGATSWLATGDEIEMDGGSGEIRLLRRAPAVA
jgi:pyruvate,water dikinase